MKINHIHLEGEYIPYNKKIEQGLEDKMSNYSLCGKLFSLKSGMRHTIENHKVTCPKCLAIIKINKWANNK